MLSLRLLAIWFASACSILCQAPDVPIFDEPAGGGVSAEDERLLARALALREAGGLLDSAAVRQQLGRRHCELELPPQRQQPLRGPALFRLARAAYVRVGWLYLCRECDDWHLDLSGGYAIAAGGVVATCHHVVAPDTDMAEGFLVCADEEGTVHRVNEVLAADPDTDVAILRTAAATPSPLPLRVDVWPGEPAFVFSDPMGSRGFFSAGIVNRFYRQPAESGEQRVNMNVSADWAPGSSGAAVLDEFGNAIGHVTRIHAHGEEPGADDDERAMATYMVLHEAVRARDVLALVRPAKAGARER